MVDTSPRRAGEDVTLCARHRQDDRTRRRVCLNCGGLMEERAVMNDLTGRPAPGRYERVCVDGCGYVQRRRR